MTDTLRWIAEELLGWKHDPGWHNSDLYWWRQEDEFHPNRREPLTYFQSWHGIGLVVEAMKKRGYLCSLGNVDSRPDWACAFWKHPKIVGNGAIAGESWLAVFEAARKAVGEKRTNEEPIL